MIDRTAEFRSLLAVRRAQPPPRPSQPSSSSSRSAFARAASALGAEIEATAGKLGKLTELAHSSTLLLFADPTDEINQLTLIVKADMARLNAELAQLQAVAHAARQPSRQQASHSSSVLEQLKGRLLDSARDFQDLLHTRKESVQRMQERRDKLAAPSPASSRRDAADATQPCTPAAPASTSIFECSSPLGAPFGAPPAAPAVGFGAAAGPSIFECGAPLAAYNGVESAWGARDGVQGGAGVGSMRPADDFVIEIPGQPVPQMQMQTQALTLPSANSSYLQSRAAAVESVQSTIVELGSIFDQLSTLVAEQGEMAQRIDDNVEDALVQTRAGYEELQKYYRSISSNRGLIIRIFAVLMFFVMMFATFA